MAYLCAIRGTRPPSPREVNSRGSSPAVGRFAPSSLLSFFPRIIELIPKFAQFRGAAPNSGRGILPRRSGSQAAATYSRDSDRTFQTWLWNMKKPHGSRDPCGFPQLPYNEGIKWIRFRPAPIFSTGCRSARQVMCSMDPGVGPR